MHRESWLFRQSPSPSTVSILSAMMRVRVYQIFDIWNSHLAGGQVWRCPFTLTLAFGTFGKSFRRNIIQRGVKLHRGSRSAAPDGYFNWQRYSEAVMDRCELRVRIRLYVPLSSSLSDSTCRVSTKRPAPLPLSLSPSLVSFLFLSLSFILYGCWWFFLLHSPRVSIAGRNAPKRDFDIPPPYGKPCNDVTSFAI